MADKLLKKRVGEHIGLANALLADEKLQGLVEDAAQRIIACYRKGGKVILMGNGGSAAEAQHMAAEFLGKFLLERKALPAIALTANSSTMTAIANDYDFSAVFRRQLEAWAAKDDVVIGISTSGKSLNVVEGLRYAKSRGIFTVGLVGGKKCIIEDVCDLCIKIPSNSTPRIQEMHTLVMHTICEEVEASLAKE